jgi:hypothetical protein
MSMACWSVNSTDDFPNRRAVEARELAPQRSVTGWSKQHVSNSFTNDTLRPALVRKTDPVLVKESAHGMNVA